MKCEVKGAKDFKTSRWSGGDTTQLYLYPEEGDYKSGNFKARISTATVEAERSEFTSLPGVERYLMIFQGELELTHGQEETLLLKPYETDRFDGGVPTISVGKVVDFNLMLKGGTKGEMEGLLLEPGQEKLLENQGWDLLAVYVKTGKIRAEEKEAKAGELLLVSQWDQRILLKNTGKEPAGLGICRIKTEER